MGLGTWASDLAQGNSTLESLLDGVPGPMCPKIDKVHSASRYGNHHTTLRDERYYDSVGEVYEVAESLRTERDDAHEMIEECRSALTNLRVALEGVVTEFIDRDAAYDEHTACIDKLEETVAELKAKLDQVGRRAYAAGYRAGHNNTVEGTWTGAPEEVWDEDEQLRYDILNDIMETT